MGLSFDNPKSLLKFLRENTSTYTPVEIPSDIVEKVLLISHYRQLYKSDLMDNVYQISLTKPIEVNDLSEILGRLEMFHSNLKHFEALDIESVISIREEVRKRKNLYKNLKTLTVGKMSYCDLKGILSGITRIAIEHEQRVDDISQIAQDLSMILEIVYSGLRIGLTDLDVRILRFVFLGEKYV